MQDFLRMTFYIKDLIGSLNHLGKIQNNTENWSSIIDFIHTGSCTKLH